MAKTEEVPLDSSEQVTTSKKNRLLALGYLGDYHCYLNVSHEEAVRRYKEHYRRMHERDLQGVAEGRFPAESVDPAFYEPDFNVIELEFNDEFKAYDIEAG